MKKLSKDQITQAIKLLLEQKIIILPTDTIYGLSAIVNDENEQKINLLKESDKNKPLIILISNPDQAKAFVDVNDIFLKHLFSKEPTTVISTKQGLDRTYALRLVKRDDVKEIIDKTGPIFSTSVNKTGEDYISDLEGLNNFSTEVDGVFFTEILANKPSNIYNLLDNSKKR